MKASIVILRALAQRTRLETMRLLVRHEPVGLAAGEIAHALEVPQNTSSAHLSILVQAGLVRAHRSGRSIVYRADLDRVRTLTLFLVKDCCHDRADIRSFLIAELHPSCKGSPHD